MFPSEALAIDTKGPAAVRVDICGLSGLIIGSHLEN